MDRIPVNRLVKAWLSAKMAKRCLFTRLGVLDRNIFSAIGSTIYFKLSVDAMDIDKMMRGEA